MKKILLVICLTLLAFPAFSATKEDNSGKGYLGTLPDLKSKYRPSETTTVRPDFEEVETFKSASFVKPVPRDNPTFVNIILKRDKTSQYVNDINEFIPILEKIYDSIDEQENVQLFNAKVYYFNKNADYLSTKYIDKPEGEYISFKKLMELSTHAKSIALLRAEAQKYNPYLAYSDKGYIYDPNNIDEQLNFLKKEVKQIILLLKDVN